ncbi:MAG TPA: SUMF1/EgtB/PvdO family nonheme iron enzyme [Terriglobia bacterium]|nr:SUMF1/EgtB/PvdO family nonheme iron enzyme [Terriglobia bacterium]
MFRRLSKFKLSLSKQKGMVLFATGVVCSALVVFTGHAGLESTSTDKFCDQTCHVHPQATQSWIKSTHYSNKSGVVTHCIECHLPPGGAEFYTEKARLGIQDIYGKLFKDVAKIDWQAKRSLDAGKTFTYDSACVKCHANLFTTGLSKKGVDAHLHYQRSKDRMRCINCHLYSGHYSEKKAEEVLDAEIDELKGFPEQGNGFRSYAETIPGTHVKFGMVAIPGGAFLMGSSDSEPYRRPDEGPLHKVRLSPFWMGRAEVSWREYEAFLTQRGTKGKQDENVRAPAAVTGPTPPYGSPDQGWGRGSRPAITMTYHGAVIFCEWLSSVTGKKYRLPTEAEWEYACRTGTSTPYFFAGDPARFTARSWINKIRGIKTSPIGEYAKYQANSSARTSPPSASKPNPWGLVNMLGNVKEFCWDWYDAEAYSKYNLTEEILNPRGPASGKEHVIRGGSFKSDASDLRSAARDHTRTDDWLTTDPQSPKSIWWYSDSNDVGFRVVRENEEGSATESALNSK